MRKLKTETDEHRTSEKVEEYTKGSACGGYELFMLGRTYGKDRFLIWNGKGRQ